MNALDRSINNDFLRVTKTLLPYLGQEQQKSVAVFAKTIELLYTIDLFTKEDHVRSLSRTTSPGWEKEFLKEVKSQLSSDKAYFIDAILKLTEARELFSHTRNASTSTTSEPTYTMHPSDSGILNSHSFPNQNANSAASTSEIASKMENSSPQEQGKSSGNPPNPGQIIDSLAPLLEPNQVQLLKILSNFIK